MKEYERLFANLESSSDAGTESESADVSPAFAGQVESGSWATRAAAASGVSFWPGRTTTVAEPFSSVRQP